jgi:hypothetical protein
MMHHTSSQPSLKLTQDLVKFDKKLNIFKKFTKGITACIFSEFDVLYMVSLIDIKFVVGLDQPYFSYL